MYIILAINVIYLPSCVSPALDVPELYVDARAVVDVAVAVDSGVDVAALVSESVAGHPPAVVDNPLGNLVVVAGVVHVVVVAATLAVAVVEGRHWVGIAVAPEAGIFQYITSH